MYMHTYECLYVRIYEFPNVTMYNVAVLWCGGFKPSFPRGQPGFDSRLHHLT